MSGNIDSQKDQINISSELSRDLNLFHITMMGLGMMIGAGVFLGIGNSIHEAGPGGVLLTFTLNGLIATFTALSYAELSSAVPRAGGAYNYARIGFGRGTSFLAGWMEWFASSVAGSLYAVTFAIYVVRYLEILGALVWVPFSIIVTEKIVAVGVACFFIYVNYRGASETGKIGAIFTLGQTLFMIFIGVIGILVAIKDPSRLQNFKPFLPHGWSKLLVTMGFTYVAFEGYEVIAQTGDETINPRQNLPKAILYSVFIVTLTYVSVAFAAIISVKAGSPGIDMAPWAWIGQFRERGFGEAIARLLPMGNLLLTLAVIFASTSALNATIYSATRALYALGRDQMLPPFFSKISHTRKTPWTALLSTGVLVLIVVTLLPTMHVASSASMMFLMLFFLVNICVIRVRWNMGDELTYGFIMPLFPIFPILAIVCQGVLAIWLVHMSIIAWIISPGWIVVGVVIYHVYSKTHVLAGEHDVTVLEEDRRAPEGDEYRIMVAVANPKNAIQMVRTTYRLCDANQARVKLLHMVPVPEQVPLSDAGKYMMEGKEAIVEAMLYLEPLFPVTTIISYCRNVARGIINAVRDKKIDLLILGWHGQPKKSYGFRFGRTIDPVIERSPCNVVVLKGADSKQQFKRILVPVAGGPNSSFALEIAGMLVDKDDGLITVFTVATDREHFDVVGFVSEHKERLQIPNERISMNAVNATNITEAILQESEDYDLVVIGCTQRSKVYQITHEAVPDAVARRCQRPIAMVNATKGIQSWIRRWI